MGENSSDKIIDLVRDCNFRTDITNHPLKNIPNEVIFQTIRGFDDIAIIGEQGTAICCGKYHEDGYYIAMAAYNTTKNLAWPFRCYYIPSEFINSLKEKHFVAILDAFFDRVGSKQFKLEKVGNVSWIAKLDVPITVGPEESLIAGKIVVTNENITKGKAEIPFPHNVEPQKYRELLNEYNEGEKYQFE